MSHTAIISIIDDDESVRVALDGLLRSHGHHVKTYASAIDFLASPGSENTACLISDIQMPGMTGIQMYDELSARGIHIPVIFLLPATPARRQKNKGVRGGAGGVFFQSRSTVPN
nr:hypothetical protein GCM10020185_78590 [Pseudomonas brassicacearum subsp. brassicacearum]